jgi:hypothetical protein
VRPWIDALFGYASADRLDMPWLPLTAEVWVASCVCCIVWVRARAARVPHPISADSRRRGLSVRPWMGECR